MLACISSQECIPLDMYSAYTLARMYTTWYPVSSLFYWNSHISMTFTYCSSLNLCLGLYYHSASLEVTFYIQSLSLIYQYFWTPRFSRFIRVTYYSWTAFSRFIPYKITYSCTFVLPSRNGQTRPLVIDSLRLISIYFTIQFMSIYSVYSLILPRSDSAGCRDNRHLLVLSVGGRDGVV